ncbi:MAG: hypothetical protein ACP5E5_05530 [Acidobacteriaceae bacterium]
MEKGPKIAIAGTTFMLLLVGLRVGLIYRANHEAGPAPQNSYANIPVDPDDNVFLRKEYPDSLADQRALIGKTLWVSAGGQLAYYSDKGNHVDYAKPLGNLLGATPLLIKGVFEQKAPASGPAVFRIPAGQRQVLLAFTMPASSHPTTLYATPVGDFQNGSYNFVNDEVFFYDDPHKLYNFWGPAMWSTIDKHLAVLGMSENQAMMSLGEVTTPSSDDTGNRTVLFDNNGHPLRIVFVNNKAVKITPVPVTPSTSANPAG